MPQNICVYCSSSDKAAPVYFDVAAELGVLIGKRGDALVFGGTDQGLMGRLARSVQEHGGKVIGVIPESMVGQGIAYDAADELIVTADMHERKAAMENSADAFIALPGGFGTLEEILETLTLKQLQYHHKAIVFINIDGFYDHLFAYFERIFSEQFAKPDFRQLFHIAAGAADAISYIESYQPVDLPRKW